MSANTDQPAVYTVSGSSRLRDSYVIETTSVWAMTEADIIISAMVGMSSPSVCLSVCL